MRTRGEGSSWRKAGVQPQYGREGAKSRHHQALRALPLPALESVTFETSLGLAWLHAIPVKPALKNRNGLVFSFWMLPMPATYVLDQRGIIRASRARTRASLTAAARSSRRLSAISDLLAGCSASNTATRVRDKLGHEEAGPGPRFRSMSLHLVRQPCQHCPCSRQGQMRGGVCPAHSSSREHEQP